MESKKIKCSLSIIQWNVIISSLKTLTFFETEEILKSIGEQSKDTKAKGHEELTIELFDTQINQLISFLQFLPYNTVSRIIYALYMALKNSEDGTPHDEEISVEVVND